MARPKRFDWVYFSVLVTREERERLDLKVKRVQAKSRNDVVRGLIKEWTDADQES